jgi:hypothetical protein
LWSALLFPTQYRRKVLGLLLMQPDQQIHLRELARVIGVAPGMLKKVLDALCEAGLLRAERVGSQVRFCANTAHPVFPAGGQSRGGSSRRACARV